MAHCEKVGYTRQTGKDLTDYSGWVTGVITAVSKEVTMADKDNFILGQVNDATSETTLHRAGDTSGSALFAINDKGQGIQGTGGNGRPGVSGFSEEGEGVLGTSTNADGVLGFGGDLANGVTGFGGANGVVGFGEGGGANGVAGWGHSAGVAAFNGNHPQVSAYLATEWFFPGSALAGLFNGGTLVFGDLFVTGTKSAVVKHPDGSDRRLYCMESPESWFEDFGVGQLHEGQADVHLDRDFAALVRTDNYHVFLTPYGDSNGLYIAHMQPDGFVVREQHGGRHSLEFGYRVVAKRGDVDVVRLQPDQLPAQPVAPQPPPRQRRRA